MKSAIAEFFGLYAQEIVFLHVFSAVVWVGGMIAIRLAVHPKLQSLEDPKIKLGRILAITGGFFNIVLPLIVLIFLSAMLMEVGLGFRSVAFDQNEHGMYLSHIVHLKEIIWFFMALNFSWMYYKRRRAQKLFDENNLPEAKKNIEPISKIFLPINIGLGVLALWFGITLRGL